MNRMNLQFTVISLVIGGIVLAGCASSKRNESAVPPVAPSPDQAASLKAAIREVNLHAQVGTVAAVITESPLVMIDEVNPQEVKPGDVFSIVGASNTVVANAVVELIVEGKVTARYEPVVRHPMIGDLAVKFQ